MIYGCDLFYYLKDIRNTEGRHQTAEESIRALTRRVEVLEKKLINPMEGQPGGCSTDFQKIQEVSFYFYFISF